VANGIKARLERMERTLQHLPVKRFEAMDLPAIRRQVCAEFGISDDELERQLTDPGEPLGDAPPAVTAYMVGFGLAMRRANLTFLDIMDLADQDVAS